MSEINSEIKKREILRLSNKESNKMTRECIEAALILLMAEKEYSEITISEIVKRAGVSRTAYYRNYESKEDILKNLLHSVIVAIYGAMKQFSYVTEQKLYWKTLFVTTKAYAESFCALLKAGFGRIILEEITQQMTNSITKDDAKDKYDMIFWSGAIYNVLANWVQDGMKQTEDEMVQICLYILENFNNDSFII
jgi:AcrR family transcriptional regulator